MTNPRVSRGRKSQVLLAERWQRLGIWPDAEAVAASLPGEDVLNTPGVHVEVKATEKAAMTEAIKQAVKGAEGTGEMPAVFYRPRGYGEERMNDWQVTLRLKDFEVLLRMAGLHEG